MAQRSRYYYDVFREWDGGWGVRGHFRPGLECFIVNCDFHGFLLEICTSLLRGTPFLSLCSRMDQLSAYSEANKVPPSPHKESGQVEDLSRDTSITPDSSQGVLLGTSTSVPTDPARSDPSRHDAPTQVSQPIQEGSQDSSRLYNSTLCWENCIGFLWSIGSVTKRCSSPTRHWMASSTISGSINIKICTTTAPPIGGSISP